MNQCDEILFKKKLIETFYAFDLFCRDHNIKYFAAYGTLIGAVRHHGLIPWDDDIDVYMLRTDYEKFCAFRGKINSHYDIIDYHDKNYWLVSLAKFVDTNTTLWETESIPYVTGVYIDVFPLDEYFSEDCLILKKKYEKLTVLVEKSVTKPRFLKKKFLRKLFKPTEAINMLKDQYYYRILKYLIRYRYDKCLNQVKSYKGPYVISYDGPYGQAECMQKSWFDDVIYMDFEDMKIPCPVGYDAILSNIYGDYMTLPPVEKRISHHSHYYLNLEQKLSIKEIKKRLYEKRIISNNSICI